jgi:hypothetical protein
MLASMLSKNAAFVDIQGGIALAAKARATPAQVT